MRPGPVPSEGFVLFSLEMWVLYLLKKGAQLEVPATSGAYTHCTWRHVWHGYTPPCGKNWRLTAGAALIAGAFDYKDDVALSMPP